MIPIITIKEEYRMNSEKRKQKCQEGKKKKKGKKSNKPG